MRFAVTISRVGGRVADWIWSSRLGEAEVEFGAFWPIGGDAGLGRASPGLEAHLAS